MPKDDEDSEHIGRPPTPQTPSSSTSGPFDNTPRKKRSPYHSDKGYGSTNSLSSESSSNGKCVMLCFCFHCNGERF